MEIHFHVKWMAKHRCPQLLNCIFPLLVPWTQQHYKRYSILSFPQLFVGRPGMLPISLGYLYTFYLLAYFGNTFSLLCYYWTSQALLVTLKQIFSFKKCQICIFSFRTGCVQGLTNKRMIDYSTLQRSAGIYWPSIQHCKNGIVVTITNNKMHNFNYYYKFPCIFF